MREKLERGALDHYYLLKIDDIIKQRNETFIGTNKREGEQCCIIKLLMMIDVSSRICDINRTY